MILGHFKAVKMDRLVIEPLAQRYVTQAKIRRIASNWSWEAFTPLTVTPLGKGFSVMDGQTHLLALYLVDPEYRGLIPCWVLPSRTLAERALMGLMINKFSTPVKPVDWYHQGLTAGIPSVVATDEALDRAGISVVYGADKIGCNETRCGHAFVRAYERLGPQGLWGVIRCSKACKLPDKSIDPVGLQATFIAGATEFVAKGGKPGKTAHAAEVLRKAGRASLSSGYKRSWAISNVLQLMWNGPQHYLTP